MHAHVPVGVAMRAFAVALWYVMSTAPIRSKNGCLHHPLRPPQRQPSLQPRPPCYLSSNGWRNRSSVPVEVNSSPWMILSKLVCSRRTPESFTCSSTMLTSIANTRRRRPICDRSLRNCLTCLAEKSMCVRVCLSCFVRQRETCFLSSFW